MGIKFGEIDASQIIENEYRIQVLERIIEKVLQKSPSAILSQNEIEKIREDVLEILNQKYPNSGLSLTNQQ